MRVPEIVSVTSSIIDEVVGCAKTGLSFKSVTEIVKVLVISLEDTPSDAFTVTA